MQAAETVQKTASGRDRAYAFLRDIVLTSAESTGTFLNEQELAAQIGVSRTPVREALLLMVSEGLIEMVPKRGAYVPPMTPRQISELIELREILERHSASVALAERHVPFAEMDAAIVAQEALVDSMSSNGTNPEQAKEFILWDSHFHQLLIDAAGSELLSKTYAGLRTRQLRAGVAALFRAEDRQRQVCTEHREIVAALVAGDEPRALQNISDHLRITKQLLLRG